jgi:hypothetical protein
MRLDILEQYCFLVSFNPAVRFSVLSPLARKIVLKISQVLSSDISFITFAMNFEFWFLAV